MTTPTHDGSPRQTGALARLAGACARHPRRTIAAWVAILVVAIGAYVESRSSSFLSEFNLNSLLLSALPLALVSMGQTSALLVGGFDVSVAALMTMCVVTASFTMTPETSTLGLIPGTLALVGVAVLTLRRRPLGNALIVLATAVAGAGSALAGLGEAETAAFVAVAAVLLYAGFVSAR
jgi:ribose/xylose/arabinose/galactoside ABC-type transport system permease subunit